jgi:putative Holliday junction resolvase
MRNDNEKLNKKYLGVDWGGARIGLAIGDSTIKIAIPFKVVSSLDNILHIIKDEAIDIVVIGQPLSMRNEKEKAQSNFLDFLSLLKKKINIPIKTVDERLSSKQADKLPGDKKTKAPQDAVAAMLILQTYLDQLN